MIIVDTSAWIEFLRATGSPADMRVVEAVDRGEAAVTEIVVMEVLAGARTAADAARIRDGLLAVEVLPLRGVADFEAAAALYRACRAVGETVRRMTDCLIAVPAIAAGVPILHVDRDFDVLARHTPLDVVAV